ncbi:hypothetical protein [Marinobacter sp. F4216]|uniref:hypothetical protein n=1 Tax=Marinobacter sp. F4216 TaxID=2874281 RepID=UPI001CBADF8A|nr:hypothetical protein [Marinobacter sp. F4216]MBZ2169469.1 hypothetical protein [Marinobacter sp. F4216]
MMPGIGAGLVRAFAACLLAGATSVVHGAGRDDFPTCYGVLGGMVQEQPAKRELFVVIDQTLEFNVDLKRHVHAKVHEYLQPGDRVSVLTFSAYAEGRYAQMPLTGKLDHPLDEDTRFETGKSDLRKFDRCMERQQAFVRAKVDETLKAAFAEASTDLPKTELMGSLFNFGHGVISASQTPEKTVLIVSDMMENSSAVSFYRNGGISNLNVDAALKQTEEAGLFSNLGGATVNVIGAGISGNDGYLSQTAMRKMQSFWRDYFEQSEARLAGWGQPELFGSIQ